MPRFFFRIHDGVDIQDREGEMHKNLQDALNEAKVSARELLASGDRIGRDRRHWSITVLDESQREVGTVAFADTVTPDGPT